jgi:hypothetical protein
MTHCIALIVAVLLVASAVAQNGLHPICARTYIKIELNTTAPLRIARSGWTKDINIFCWSHDVALKPGGPSHCTPGVAGHTLFYFVGYDTNGAERYRSNFSHVIDGSLTSLYAVLADPLRFEFYAVNLEAGGCPVMFNYSMTDWYRRSNTPSSAPALPEPMPVLTAVVPKVAFLEDPVRFQFQLAKGNSPSDGLSQLSIGEVTEHVHCRYATAAGAVVGDAVVAASPRAFSWTHSFNNAGGRVLCVRPTNASKFIEIARFHVFANPAYFLAYNTRSTSSRVYFSMSFIGYHLNPKSDSVKVVDFYEPCVSAAQLGSVTVGSLEPSTATSAHNVTVGLSLPRRNSLLLRICYYTSHTRTWHHVPNYYSLSFSAKANISGEVANGTAGTRIVPTAPAGCTTAPARADMPTQAYLQLTFDRSFNGNSFKTEMGTYLCIPASAVYIYSVRVNTAAGSGDDDDHDDRRSGGTTTDVIMEVRCTSTTMCYSQERMDYLVYAASSYSGLAAALKTKFGITGVKEVSFTGLASNTIGTEGSSGDDDNGRSDRGTLIAIIVVIIIVFICVVVILCYCIVRARRKAAAHANEHDPVEVEHHVVQGVVMGDVMPPQELSPRGEAARDPVDRNPTTEVEVVEVKAAAGGF